MDFLLEGFKAIGDDPKMIVMWLIGGLLIFLAIKKDMEPALLLPMGFGAILVNLPLSPVIGSGAGGEHLGIITSLFKVGIEASEAMPLLLFIGIGCMIDFGPLLTNPKLFILGGAADGPTAILVAQQLMSNYVGPIMVVAYSYMALVPIIQPAVMKLCTTKKERLIKMKYSAKQVSKPMRILFPIIVTIVSGVIAPDSLSLVGMLMFGNLLRECGVLGSLSETAQTTFSNIITLLLGITISFQMQAAQFLRVETLIIMALGLFAFVFDTVGGIMCAKLMNLFCKEKINPLIGAAGISAFPMASRVVEKVGNKEDRTNHLLMHAVGTNVSGQIASAIVGGLIIGIILPLI